MTQTLTCKAPKCIKFPLKHTCTHKHGRHPVHLMIKASAEGAPRSPPPRPPPLSGRPRTDGVRYSDDRASSSSPLERVASKRFECYSIKFRTHPRSGRRGSWWRRRRRRRGRGRPRAAASWLRPPAREAPRGPTRPSSSLSQLLEGKASRCLKRRGGGRGGRGCLTCCLAPFSNVTLS